MLALKNVTKRYKDRIAVDDLSLTVKKGEVLGLLGPNGAGKSTTCHLMCGLLQSDAGEVTLEGRSPSDPAVRELLGLAPQKIALYDRLSARQNLKFFSSLYPSAAKNTEAAIDEVLALVGLQERGDEPVKQFSGGMLRRLNLAAAFIHKPSLLLLDEPTAGVDPQSRNRLFETVETLKSRGTTVIYTTHYMEEAARLCDRVAIIDQGKLLALDTVAALIKTHGGPSRIRYEKKGEQHELFTPSPEKTLTEVLQQTETVRDLNVTAPTLESVFLKLTGKHLRD